MSNKKEVLDLLNEGVSLCLSAYSQQVLEEIYEFAKQPATNKMEILDMIEKKIKEESNI